MKRVVYTETGDPGVLQLTEAESPEPGPGEVRVRLRRAGVNPTDWKSRTGSGPGQPVDPPQTPGQDGAGLIDAVGEGVDPALVGLPVWVWEAAFQRPWGTAAEQTLVPVHQAVSLPDPPDGSDPFDLGAALGIPFLTAHRCLTVAENGPQRLGPGTLAGRTVLVAGGAGAVGNAAIQLARWSDATVISTVSSPQKAQSAAAAGADHVINYRNQDVVAELRKIAPHGADLIIEVSPGPNAAIIAGGLAVGGTVAIYANNGGDEVTLSIRPLMTTNARLQFVLVYTAPHEAKLRAAEDVVAGVTAGAIRVGEPVGLPLLHFSLEETAQAHQAVEDGAVGKVIIDITD
ncbi:NADPH2:quinone reductase [Friedmanniella endophytica]|uniref:NADPH2:quinone reductase n=1 Tax=Microlunatus kandeliicorticis TaxID=1759536 RepID=A0A7W3P6B0_9ACTN|nr:NADPH:quinone reductase [Microlunatus kandeliicorticis]MBA8794788.1 NADPH2:quinone reductase [Microlunatus kandeliicorticis]